MAGTVTLGLAKIEVGAVASDGGMGATLSQLGYTTIDTCTFTSEDATKTDFNVEELDEPIDSSIIPGKQTLGFSIADPNLDALISVMGGAKRKANQSDTTETIWEPDNQAVIIERSIRVTPRKGYMFEFPRMSVTAKWNAQFGKNNMAVVEVSADVLTPTKSGVKKYICTRIDTV